MPCRFSMLVFGCALGWPAYTVSAQSLPVWDWVGPYAMANLNREVLDRRLEDERAGEIPDATERADASTSAPLTYTASAERRRTNLANFANMTRQTNPESAAAMDAMFAGTDIIQQFGTVLSSYGYSVTNVGDAYAAWWMLAWKAANGDTSDPTAAQFTAVQAQAHDALAGSSQMAVASDAAKQEMAEALLMHAAMAEALNGMAAEQSELRARVRQSVRQGANSFGLDLDAMQLTEKGFVSR